MKYGVATSGTTPLEVLEKIAVRAEDLGYDYLLVTDHYMSPKSSSTLDAWTFLSYVAALTKKIRLGTCVTPIPFRRPAILAKMISTLDNLSGGRAILGAGAGWHRPEFEAYSTWLGDHDRVTFTSEALDLMIRLWTQSTAVDFTGRLVSASGALLEPKPIQKPHPPIWFGTLSKRMLRMCGRLGDGWLPVGPRWIGDMYPRPDEYSKMRQIILPELQRRGYPLEKFFFSTIINYADSRTLLSEIEAYRREGMNHFTLGLSREADEHVLEKLERVSKEVCSSI